MRYTTREIVDISIDVGGTGFKETAGYGPNETGAIAEIPCSGAGTSSVQLKGCNANRVCVESDKKPVTVSG